MSTLGKDLNVAEASRLAAKLRLSAVHISGIQARMIAPDLDGEIGWRLLPIKFGWGIADGQLRVVVPVSLHVLKQTSQPTNIAEIGVLLRLDYDRSDGDEPDAAIESFVGISGCMHAWPYIRAEIHQLSTKLELPPLVLPPIVSGDVVQLVGEVSRVPPPRKTNEVVPTAKPKKSVKRSKTVAKRAQTKR